MEELLARGARADEQGQGQSVSFFESSRSCSSQSSPAPINRLGVQALLSASEAEQLIKHLRVLSPEDVN